MTLLRSSNQYWKLWLFGGILVIGGLVIALGGLMMGLGESMESLGTAYILIGTAVGLSAFLCACLLVGCPRCSARWFWLAVSGQTDEHWLQWLSNLSICPHCGYPNEIGHFET
jgi:hypothetical protein